MNILDIGRVDLPYSGQKLVAGGERIYWIETKISVYPMDLPIYEAIYHLTPIYLYFGSDGDGTYIGGRNRISFYSQRFFPPYGSNPVSIIIWTRDPGRIKLDLIAGVGSEINYES